ncbi:HAMP domain-containing sensor histidine kinase [Halorubrum sp. F4]|uniref:sensor histidine kinase n=1 Tax=Halorubrum sp. F4 TaxID=2989715 RepID=UPI00248013B6|nr:HAMP domain-containing sensor histidine kinase [Halorubrum sp. F4]
MDSRPDSRPGVAYRRPDGDPERVVFETDAEPELSVGDLSGETWLDSVHPEDRDRLCEELTTDEVDLAYRLVRDWSAYHGDAVDDGATDGRATADSTADSTANDAVTWVHERGRRDENGDTVGYLFPAYDRFERERRLERQRERLEEFASVVSHDLRNPLSVAVGNLELAREFDGDDAVERIDRAHDALDRMDELISDLLSLAREGRSVEATAETDLQVVVDRAWATVGRAANAELVVEEPLPRIECDRNRLRQALENLFRNAIEHGSDEEIGEDAVAVDDDAIRRQVDSDGVRVFVGRTDDGFYVADDGPGIPEERREEIFEPGHTTAEEGTGFGLAIVERIVEAHGWSVGVTESNAAGARFEFSDVNQREDSGADADDDAVNGTTAGGLGSPSAE